MDVVNHCSESVYTIICTIFDYTSSAAVRHGVMYVCSGAHNEDAGLKVPSGDNNELAVKVSCRQAVFILSGLLSGHTSCCYLAELSVHGLCVLAVL